MHRCQISLISIHSGFNMTRSVIILHVVNCYAQTLTCTLVTFCFVLQIDSIFHCINQGRRVLANNSMNVNGKFLKRNQCKTWESGLPWQFEALNLIWWRSALRGCYNRGRHSLAYNSINVNGKFAIAMYYSSSHLAICPDVCLAASRLGFRFRMLRRSPRETRAWESWTPS